MSEIPGHPLKALALGLAVDIGGSVVGTLALALGYGIFLALSGASREEIAAAAQASGGSWFFYASSVVGLACSGLGGYVCARTARRSELTLGALLAVVSTTLGFAFASDEFPLGTLLSFGIAGVGAVMFGARAGKQRNRRARAAS